MPRFLQILILYSQFCFGFSVAIAATANCEDNEYETDGGTCYPSWGGQTASGAYYTIVIPPGWQDINGLVIFNHGLQGYQTGWGMKDFQTLLDFGFQSLFLSEPEPNPTLAPRPFEDIILAQGYALAASSYSQTGWAVFDSHIANKELYDVFLSIAEGMGQAAPDPLIIMGGSLGGIVTLRDLEAGLIPDIDGALLACGAVAGAENWREAFDVRMIYEAVCSDVSNGSLPEPWYEKPNVLAGEIAFLNSLEACAGLTSRYTAIQAAEDKALAEQAWRFSKLLTSQGRAQLDRLDRILQLTNSIDEDTLVTTLGYAVFELSSLIEDPTKLNGAIPFHNVGVDYGDADLNRKIRRSVGLPEARQKLDASYTPSGNIGNARLLSIHTSLDGLVKVQNQLTLQEFAATNPALQNQISIAVVDEERQSHCGFTESEKIAVWKEFSAWVGDGLSFGSQPNASSIQESCESSIGFIDDDFGSEADSGVGPSESFIEASDRCRFSPGFTLAGSLLSFPRSAAVSSVGSNAYLASSGELNVEQLRIPGDDTLYDVTLSPPPSGSTIFTPKTIIQYGTESPWQHSSYFDPAQSLIYLPRVQIPDAIPIDPAEYTVYLRLLNENGIDGLQYIDLEIVP